MSGKDVGVIDDFVKKWYDKYEEGRRKSWENNGLFQSAESTEQVDIRLQKSLPRYLIFRFMIVNC